MTQQIQVNLGERSYPIYIGQSLMSDSETLSRYLLKKRILIVTNETVAPLYLNQVQDTMASFGEVSSVILPDGEQFKDLTHLDVIFRLYCNVIMPEILCWWPSVEGDW